MSDGEKKTKKRGAAGTKTATDENVFLSSSLDDYEPPSVTFSVFLYWILPVLVIACTTRFVVDPDAAAGLGIREEFGVPIPVQPPSAATAPITTTTTTKAKPPSSLPTAPAFQPTPERPKRKPTPVPSLVADKPTGYIEVVKAVARRRLDWDNVDASTMEGYSESDAPPSGGSATGKSGAKPTGGAAKPNAAPTTVSSPTQAPTPPKTRRQQQQQPRGASTDPVRNRRLERIDELRNYHRDDPTDLYKLIELADALRLYDVQYHDGGTAQEEAIHSYKTAISLALETRQTKLELGEDTRSLDVAGEITKSYSSRSIDGVLCGLYTSLGKVYFMSNMFEMAVESYSKAIDIEPMYLDAVASRGSSGIILGQYESASQDFIKVMENDELGMFLDVYTGLARILQARESAVPIGWGPMIEKLNEMIPELEQQHAIPLSGNHAERQAMIARTLNRLFHVLFLYHDVKTKDVDAAWENLSKSYRYKMSALPPWNAGFEKQKISSTKQIFRQGFWPSGVGSKSSVPIFIIGFVRSGSTLLERVLDAHPQIVGMGENSVFNGQLDHIRNKIVETSLRGDANALSAVIASLANGVVEEMRERWKMVSSVDRARVSDGQKTNPKRFADKMLTNYYNVGFIHMLFPNALILHVVREPMDTIFSAYKHEFPAGTLDYTSDFPSLAELYDGYRDLMDHWDRELPGRVTHIRYEDMVHDMPGVARKIIDATGLEWDDSILDFHKKKQAVNTLSTTQVRKGVYKDSLQAWRRYEKHLGPLLKLIGDKTTYGIRTSLPGYERPPVPATASQNDSRSEEAPPESESEGDDRSRDEL